MKTVKYVFIAFFVVSTSLLAIESIKKESVVTPKVQAVREAGSYEVYLLQQHPSLHLSVEHIIKHIDFDAAKAQRVIQSFIKYLEAICEESDFDESDSDDENESQKVLSSEKSVSKGTHLKNCLLCRKL